MYVKLTLMCSPTYIMCQMKRRKIWMQVSFQPCESHMLSLQSEREGLVWHSFSNILSIYPMLQAKSSVSACIMGDFYHMSCGWRILSALTYYSYIQYVSVSAFISKVGLYKVWAHTLLYNLKVRALIKFPGFNGDPMLAEVMQNLLSRAWLV